MIEKIKLTSGEEIFIKKGWDGYRVCYPNKKDLTKPFSKENAHWKNIIYGGHWSYIFKLIIFLILLYFFVQMYLQDTEICREFVENWETICSMSHQTGEVWNMEINFSDFNLIENENT